MKTILLAFVLTLSIPAIAQTNWELSSSGTSDNFFGYSMIANGDTLYTSGTDLVAGQRKPVLYKSVNNGTSWQEVAITTQFPDSTMLYVQYHGGNYILANQYTGTNLDRWTMKVSYDGGSTWFPSLNGLDSTIEFINSVAKLDNGTLIAAGSHLIDGKTFFTSTDNGKSWTQMPAPRGLLSDYLLSLHYAQQRLYCLAGSTSTYNIYKSDDEGANWKKVATQNIPFDARPLKIVTDDNKDIYVLAELQNELKVYHTSDSGQFWTELSYTGLPLTSYTGVRYAHYNNQIFYVGVTAIPNYATKIYRSNPLGLSTPTVAETTTRLYPNPAADSLLVEGVEMGSTIEVYNLQGQKVIEFIETGAALDISPLPKGLYLLNAYGAGKNYSAKFVKE